MQWVLFLVLLAMVVLSLAVGFTLGVEVGKRKQFDIDHAVHVRTVTDLGHQLQESWFQLGRMRRAWRVAREQSGLGQSCECCSSTNLAPYCKDCGQVQFRPTKGQSKL